MHLWREQECIIHFHTIIGALQAEEKDEQCLVHACIHAYVHACVCVWGGYKDVLHYTPVGALWTRGRELMCVP